MEETDHEELEDQFASIIQFCVPTTSQEAKLQNCPFAREFDYLAGPNKDACPSSPDLTQSPHAPILMVSLPDSDTPLTDDAIFHTPPDRDQHLSSSDDQNVFHECTKIAELDEEDGFKEAFIKGFVGDETRLANDTEVVCLDDGETMPMNETEVVCLDYTETVDLDEDAVQVIGKGGVRIRRFDVENLSVGGMAKGGTLAEQNHGLEKVNTPNAVGEFVSGKEMREECVFERVGRVEEVENNVFGGGKKRLFPDSLKGKEKIDDAERRKRNPQFLELLDMLKVVIGYARENGCEEGEDFLESAKRRGLTFLRPRWWPSVGYG